LVRVRLALDHQATKVGDTVFLQVLGAHSCFYEREELIA
jgi:hypothetical protein